MSDAALESPATQTTTTASAAMLNQQQPQQQGGGGGGGHSASGRGDGSVISGGRISPSQRGAHAVVERKSDNGNRILKIEQYEIFSIGGDRIKTKIEVLDARRSKGGDRDRDTEEEKRSVGSNRSNLNGEEEIVFSVRHTHGHIWSKELVVHKNLLVACILADVECPIEIPQSSISMFVSAENPQHIHLYLEKVVPHLRFPRLPQSVASFWWRAVGNGSLLFLNWKSGKILILPNQNKTIPSAALTLRRALDVAQDLPPSFLEVDRDYASLFPPGGAQTSDKKATPGKDVFPDRQCLAETLQSWALEDDVSPWMTKLIVKSKLQNKRGQVTNFRYSLGVDADGGKDAVSAAADDADQTSAPEGGAPQSVPVGSAGGGGGGGYPSLSLQVHSNEPLSRELKAFPVCMLPVPLSTSDVSEVGEVYLKSLWFLRKIFDYHVRMECKSRTAQDAKKHANRLAAGISDRAPLDDRMKLMGGVRLAEPITPNRPVYVKTERMEQARSRF